MKKYRIINAVMVKWGGGGFLAWCFQAMIPTTCDECRYDGH